MEHSIGYDDLFPFENDTIRNADFIAVGPVRTNIFGRSLIVSGHPL